MKENTEKVPIRMKALEIPVGMKLNCFIEVSIEERTTE
jgi:hypothetical protein